MHTQFFESNQQHGRAFLTIGFLAAAFECGGRGLLCSKAFLYSLCFILLYRLRTCFDLILRNLIFVLGGVLRRLAVMFPFPRRVLCRGTSVTSSVFTLQLLRALFQGPLEFLLESVNGAITLLFSELYSPWLTHVANIIPSGRA